MAHTAFIGLDAGTLMVMVGDKARPGLLSRPSRELRLVSDGAQRYPSIQRRQEEQVKVLIICTVSSRPGHETISPQKQSKDAKRRSVG